MAEFFFYLLILLLPVQLGRHFWPEWAYVWGIRIDYLAPTVYLTDIIILLILFFWLKEKWGKREKGDKRDKTINVLGKVLPYFLILGFIIINCFLAKNHWSAVYKLIKVLEMGVLAIYVKRFVSNVIPSPAKGGERNPRRFTDSGWDPSTLPRPASWRARDSLGMTVLMLAISVFYSSLITIFQFLKQGSIGGLLWFLGERTFTAQTPGISQIDLAGRLFLRPYATFPHPNVLAGFLTLSLLIILSFVIARSPRRPKQSRRKILQPNGIALSLTSFVPRNDRKRKLLAMTGHIFYLLTFFLGLVALFLTFSRTAILAFLIGAIFVLKPFLFKKRVRRRKGIRREIILTFLLLLVTSYVLLVTKIKSPESLTYRSELNKIALKMIAGNPIFGVGLNNFIVRLPDYGPPGMAVRFLQPVHNIYLLIAAELGIPGLIIVAVAVFSILYKVFKKQKINQPLITNYLLLITILFLGLFDHYFLTLQQGQIIFALVLGLNSKMRYLGN